MKKFSSNYAYTNHNYVIQNLDYEHVKDNIYYSTICVVKNIIQRGTPTILSSYLQKETGAIHKDKDFTKYLPLIDNKTPVWERLIRGDTENNYNPAKIFFEKLIPDDIKYIQNLLAPETLIEDIVQEKNEKFCNQQVDFYLPQAFLVIEIDGAQHTETQQKRLDFERDEYLEKKGIKVIRITTKEINNGNIENKLELIRKRLQEQFNNKIKLEDYDNAYKNGINLNNKFYLATAINRFQILILELLACQKLNFKNDWNIEIISDKDLDKRFAELAVKDLFEWFKKLFALQKTDFMPPKYNIKFNEFFSNSSNGIKIDFSLLKRYTDENQTNPNIIYVRTDYFDQYIYIHEGNVNAIEKQEYRDYDYFKVSIANLINYSVDISNKNTEKILFSLAWDLFLQNNNDLSFETATFREGQLDIIVNALQKKDTIGLLPTGSGKSLCYQLVCLLQPAISFVVCPLKSLMRDQTDELNNNFITRINFISSDCSTEERVKILKDYINGKYLFVLISPERFQTKEFRNTLPANVAYAVIDEVHCLSEWGHDFRTAYLNLVPAIKNQCKNITFMALTATASLNVLKDIKIELNITDDNNIKTPKYYSREELEFIIYKCDIANKKNELEKLITTIKQDEFYKYGIVFTATVSQSKHLGGCKDLSNSFYYKFPNDNVRYISGTPPKEIKTDEQKEKFNKYKIETQNMFKKGEIKLLFATKSFGMGINKTDIAYTIHYSIPSSLESLYQQAGRAGRSKMLFNKKKAKCYILFSAENLKQETLNKLWNRNSDYNTVKTNNDLLTADLASQVYFFCNSNESIDEGYEELKKLKEHICENINEQNIVYSLKKDKNDMQEIDEKFIMKMKQLGIVEDWLVDFNKNQCTLILNEHFKFLYKENRDKIENFIEDNVEAIIRKYDKEFSFSNLNNSDDERYINFKKYNNIQDYFEKYVKILLQWNYDNFGYNRRQALKTLYETCIEISEKENKTASSNFKEKLENYFKFSNKTNILQFIADNPLKYEKWFDIFYKYEDAIKTNKIIDKQEVKSLIDNLARILESYKQNTGLDFISGLLRLFYNDYFNADGKDRLESSLKQIKLFEPNIQKDIFEQLFQIVDMYKLEDKNREELSESILNVYTKDLEFIKYVYNNLKDDYSLSCILGNHSDKLKNIKNKIEV